MMKAEAAGKDGAEGKTSRASLYGGTPTVLPQPCASWDHTLDPKMDRYCPGTKPSPAPHLWSPLLPGLALELPPYGLPHKASPPDRGLPSQVHLASPSPNKGQTLREPESSIWKLPGLPQAASCTCVNLRCSHCQWEQGGGVMEPEGTRDTVSAQSALAAGSTSCQETDCGAGSLRIRRR